MNVKLFIVCLISIHSASSILNTLTPLAKATLSALVNNNAPISVLTSFISTAGTAIGISNNPNDVHFFFYPYGGSKTEIVFNNAASLAASGFNPNLPTIIVTDGFLSNSTSPMSLALSESYPKRYQSGVNTIVTDYGALSGAEVFLIDVSAAVALATYPIVITNAPAVGARLAQFIKFLGVDSSRVRLVGHSLGAQISGMAGTYAQTNYGVSYSRITGLDPAGPLYTGGVTLPPNQKLSADNAAFVDALHTNMGKLGTTDTNNGDIDIVVNGGGTVLGGEQPGCSVLDYPAGGTPGLGGLSGFCSHSYSWRIYNATIFSNNILGGVCDDSIVLVSSCFQKQPPAGYVASLLIGENIPYGSSGKYSVYSIDSYTAYETIIG